MVPVTVPAVDMGRHGWLVPAAQVNHYRSIYSGLREVDMGDKNRTFQILKGELVLNCLRCVVDSRFEFTAARSGD